MLRSGGLSGRSHRSWLAGPVLTGPCLAGTEGFPTLKQPHQLALYRIDKALVTLECNWKVDTDSPY